MCRMLPVVLFTTAGLAAACSDPLGPCERRFACEVQGIDLAVLDVDVIGGNEAGVDPVTRYPIYGPGRVTAIATFVNRGDSIAPETRLSNGRTLPSLAPGETFRDTVVLDIAGTRRLQAGADPRMADVTYVQISVVQLEWDADATNDYGLSEPFHATVPVLGGTLELGGQRTEVRANSPFVVAFSIRNHSVHGAALDSMDAVLCMIDVDVGCWGNWPYFGRFELARIEGNSVYQNAYMTSVPPEATIWPDEAHTGRFAMCLVPSSLTEPYMPTHSTCVSGVNLTVRPDYSACSPPAVEIGVPLTLSTPNCTFPQRLSTLRHSVVALDAVAGQQYSIAPGGAYHFIANADGDRVSLPVAEDGRYYIVFYHILPITVTVSRP